MKSQAIERYSKDFYESLDGTLLSAKIISTLVYDLVRPKSVVDVGCGKGIWLKQFEQLGVEQITGIDGKWIDKKDLLIPLAAFLERDLEKPIQINRKFDLVISLEVAEHLPQSSAETFVHSLVNLGDVVLFSAAIPHQGGDHHVNEQWPDYWENLFKKFDFVIIDCVRRPMWDQKGIVYYYAQNCFLFVSKTTARYRELFEISRNTSIGVSRAIHPGHYLQKMRYLEDPKTLSTLGIRLLVAALTHAICSKFSRK